MENKELFEIFIKYLKKYNISNVIGKIVIKWNNEISLPLSDDIVDMLEKGMQKGVNNCISVMQQCYSGTLYGPAFEQFTMHIKDLYEASVIDLRSGEIHELPCFFVFDMNAYNILKNSSIGNNLLELIDKMFDKKGIIL